MSATITTPVATEARKFETTTCGRCGGSGHYSYCPSHGTTCFGCGGSGVRYTKRGFAAKQFYEALCEVEARDLIVGQSIRQGSVTMGGTPFSKFAKINSIRVLTSEDEAKGSYSISRAADGTETRTSMMPAGHLYIETAMYGQAFAPSDLVRLAQCKEAKSVKLEMAYDHQDTLTKSGTVRKR